MKAVNSAKRKRVEEVMDLRQGDYQLPGTDKMLTDIAMVPPILMAGIKSTGYKSKRSDRNLTGATLEIEILSQCGESSIFRRRNEDYAKNTCSRGSALRKNRVTTEVCLLHDGTDSRRI